MQSGNKYNFSNISRKKCLIAYKGIIEHSNQKVKTAELLAKTGDYGTGISLLIISNEEMIKALILSLDGRGFDFRKIKGVDNLFTNHKLRYLLSMIISIGQLFLLDFKKYFEKTLKNPEIAIEFKRRGKQGLESALTKNIKFYFLRKIVQLKKEIEWFSEVEIFRQKGFYSDYENELVSPNRITHEQFELFYRKIIELNNAVKYIIESFNDYQLLLNESIEDLKKQFSTNGWYEDIKRTLAIINSPKYNSYESLWIFIKEIYDETKNYQINKK